MQQQHTNTHETQITIFSASFDWMLGAISWLLFEKNLTRARPSTIYAMSSRKGKKNWTKKKLWKRNLCHEWKYSVVVVVAIVVCHNMKYKGSFCWTFNYHVHCKHFVNELCLHIVIHSRNLLSIWLKASMVRYWPEALDQRQVMREQR